MKFKEFIQEAEDKNVKLALQWLKLKFGKKYNFKYKPDLNDSTKSYPVSIKGTEFVIKGKKFDTNGDGEPDTVLFKITYDHDEGEF